MVQNFTAKCEGIMNKELTLEFNLGAKSLIDAHKAVNNLVYRHYRPFYDATKGSYTYYVRENKLG